MTKKRTITTIFCAALFAGGLLSAAASADTPGTTTYPGTTANDDHTGGTLVQPRPTPTPTPTPPGTLATPTPVPVPATPHYTG